MKTLYRVIGEGVTFDCCRHCGDMACPGGRNDHEVPCPSCQKQVKE